MKCFKKSYGIPSVMEAQEIASKTGYNITENGCTKVIAKQHSCEKYKDCIVPQSECPLGENNDAH